MTNLTACLPDTQKLKILSDDEPPSITKQGVKTHPPHPLHQQQHKQQPKLEPTKMHSPINFIPKVSILQHHPHRTLYHHPPLIPATATTLLRSRLLLSHSRGRQNLLLLKQLRQLAILMHGDEDIASTDELFIDV